MKILIERSAILNLILQRCIEKKDLIHFLQCLTNKQFELYVTQSDWEAIVYFLTTVESHYRLNSVFACLFLNSQTIASDKQIFKQTLSSNYIDPYDCSYLMYAQSLNADALLVSNAERFSEYDFKILSISEFKTFFIDKYNITTDYSDDDISKLNSLISETQKGVNGDFHAGDFRLHNLNVYSGNTGKATVKVEFVDFDGNIQEAESYGDGLINATFKAIDSLIIYPEREVFSFSAYSSSIEGNVTAFVGIIDKHTRSSYTSCVKHQDTVYAAAGAYLLAINQALKNPKQ